MELIKKNIYMEQRFDLASTQISLEEDQNISDQNPDAFQIICKKASVKVEEVKVQEDTICIRGALLYDILYLTDEKEKRLCSMDGELLFDEKIYVNQLIGGEDVRIVTNVEDLMIRLINSRKLNIRCIISVLARQDRLYNEELIVDVDEPQACEVLNKPLDITTIIADTKDIYRIKEEIQLPDGLPNIYKLLWKNIRINGLNYIPMDGKIGIQGEWSAFFLFEGEEEESLPRYFELTRPFSGVLEVPDCRENMFLCVECEEELPQIEVRSDYDGEERVIGMDMELKLSIKLYQNTVMSVVADVYGLNERLEPIYKESVCHRLLKRENGKIKLNEYWENKEETDETLQILNMDSMIIDEKTVINKNEVQLQGVMHVELLCRSNNENHPYKCIHVDIPYSQTINVPSMDSLSLCCSKISVEQMVAVEQSNRIEIRVILSYQMDIYQKINQLLLAGMDIGMEKRKEDMLPVMSVYFAKEGEGIWDIGKKYRVQLNEIREINQLNSDILQEGQRILIAKEIV